MVRYLCLLVCMGCMSSLALAQTVLCDGQTFDGYTSTPFQLRAAQSNSIIRNCVFKNAGDVPAISLWGADDVLIQNCRFENIRSGQAGNDTNATSIDLEGNRITFEGNVFVDIGSDGIQIGGGNEALYIGISDVTIRNNVFYVTNDDVGENGIDIKQTTDNIIIENNDFYGFRKCDGAVQDCSGSEGEGIIIHGKSETAPARNVYVRRNRFYNNEYGIWVGKAVRPVVNIVIENNWVYDNLDNGIRVSNNSLHDVDILHNTFVNNNNRHINVQNANIPNCRIYYNLFLDDTLNTFNGCVSGVNSTFSAAQAAFVDLAGRNLRITQASLAVDNIANPTIPVLVDYDNTTRPVNVNWDAGSHEFLGVAQPGVARLRGGRLRGGRIR